MTAVSPRTFRAEDVQPIVALWNESVLADPTTVAWFTRSVLLDPDFDPECLLVVDGDDSLAGSSAGAGLAGCCYAARHRALAAGPELGGAADPDAHAGWIVFLFVHPLARRQGIASSLLDRAVRLLARRGCTDARLASWTPHYVAPGLDAAAYPGSRGFLTASGFVTSGEVVAMTAGLVGATMPVALRERRAALTAAGYRFGPPADGELPELIRFAAHTFAADWADALRELLRRRHDARPVTTVHRGDQLLGFAAHGCYRGVAERFGPFGVDPSTRGLGLGRLLLAQALVDMRADGLQNAWFLWTEEDSAAGHLYRSAGFVVNRRFSLWNRPL